MPTRLAVFGDVHGSFSRDEARSVDRLGYDGVLFVGDLGGALPGSLRRVARAIATLRTPAVVLPGNHDGPSPLGIFREAALGGWHPSGSVRRLLRRTARIEGWLGPVPLGGYSLHPMGGVTVVAARPWAMDGRRASFGAALAARHDVRTLAESTVRLRQLLDQVRGPVVLLAHNGPAGLGVRDEDPWSHRGRDIGDTDLTAALGHGGENVRAVVAGHMHLGRARIAVRALDRTLCVNAAEVPRRGRHILLTVEGEHTAAAWASI